MSSSRPRMAALVRNSSSAHVGMLCFALVFPHARWRARIIYEGTARATNGHLDGRHHHDDDEHGQCLRPEHLPPQLPSQWPHTPIYLLRTSHPICNRRSLLSVFGQRLLAQEADSTGAESPEQEISPLLESAGLQRAAVEHGGLITSAGGSEGDGPGRIAAHPRLSGDQTPPPNGEGQRFEVRIRITVGSRRPAGEVSTA